MLRKATTERTSEVILYVPPLIGGNNQRLDCVINLFPNLFSPVNQNDLRVSPLLFTTRFNCSAVAYLVGWATTNQPLSMRPSCILLQTEAINNLLLPINRINLPETVASICDQQMVIDFLFITTRS